MFTADIVFDFKEFLLFNSEKKTIVLFPNNSLIRALSLFQVVLQFKGMKLAHKICLNSSLQNK